MTRADTSPQLATSGAAPATAPVVLAGARMPGADALVDVHLADGRVARIAPAGATTRDAEVVDVDGRFVLPGLWDRHVHMTQWSMVSRRLDVSAASSAAETTALVAASVAAGATEVVGFGYRDGLWPDAPSIAALDAVSGAVPVVLVAADLHACWINSAAAARHGATAAARESGVLREDDCFRLVRAVDDVAEDVLDRWVGEAARRAAQRGVVGVVDYEMRWNRDDWVRRFGRGVDALRVAFGVYPQHLERAIADGLRTGDPLPGTAGLVEVGGAKAITDGSLNTRTAWCFDPYPGLGPDEHPYGIPTIPIDELVPLMRRAHAGGLVPAIHAIGDRANAAVLDAFETVGCGGSVEHAQLVTDADVARFARLGLVASVQPEHAMDDRDVADHYWSGRTHRAFRLADLAAAGVELALGSDAPVAPLDPWVAIAAAVGRARDGREPWHPEQAVDAATAIAASIRGAGVVLEVGRRADVAVVDRDPLRTDADGLRRMPVAATLVDGRFTHRDAALGG